jgi:hypothetical protein
VYTWDAVSNEIKLEIEVNSGDGVHLKLIKYLCRFDASANSQDVVFTNWRATQGWSKYDFWPSTVFGECKVQIVKAAKILTSNRSTMQDNKILEVLWTRSGFTDDFNVNLSTLAHSQSLCQTAGEEVIIYCTQVMTLLFDTH